MLQEATKILNSAFHNSFIKRLSLYLHDCVREEVKSSTFRNLKQDKENQWIFLAGEEKMFKNFPEPLMLDGADSNVTKLMALSDMSQKDKYLIYGYLFLVGKNKRSSEFLTPLLYMPCKLERDGVNISCNLQDEVLSVNTGALIHLMQKTDDDEMEHLLSSLVDVVPDLPLTQEKLDIFLTTLRAIIPDLKVNINHEDDETEINIDNSDRTAEEFYSSDSDSDFESTDDIIDELDKSKPNKKVDNVSVTGQCALILTKRPQVTAGVLHELIQIAEKPSGIFRETALYPINEEYLQGSGKLVEAQQTKKMKDFIPVTPLSLSDSQESVIKKIEENQLVSVYGPPGTGKSQTIVNLVTHLIANGKTVLVASRMDKAVDVVAERLNELGAPYLALRAGRPDYQKKLKFDLEDLVAQKVDLNSGYEKSMLVDIKDMEVLLSTKREMEDKCEQIINLEKEYHDIILQKQAEEINMPETKFINRTLKKDEIETVKVLVEKIEQNSEKTGFFTSWTTNGAVSKIQKILNINNFSADIEDIQNLKAELRVQELYCKARLIEAQIHKIGNLHSLLEQIRLLKKKQRNLAIEILKNKRRNSLKDLLNDPVKRRRLITHSKALTAHRKSAQDTLEEEDFKPLLDAFPCWCVTTYAISGSIPMKPGLFDVVIIDEASQCDIASCFPLLYRAKRAVIVGDDKQLPHLSFLEKAKEQSFLTQYEIPSKYQLIWRFRTNSMFDLANYYSMTPVLLDEHFRSSKPIIDFSNKEFYGNRIRIMNRSTDFKGVLEVNYVYDGKVDYAVTKNMPEAEEVVKKIHELITDNEHDDPDNPQTIGVISPFRAQVELIKRSIMQVLSDSVIRKYKIEVGTAHTFQGDERDIMILSWAIAGNSHSQSLTFLQRPNLFNVAITRARKKLICFISKDPKTLQEGLLRSYMEYMLEYEEGSKTQKKLNTDVYKNDFEKEVAKALKENGVEVRAGVEVAGFSTDLLINLPKKEQIILEIDGVEDSIKSPQTNIKKQTILERCGFKVIRLSYREWLNSKTASMDRIMSNL